MPFIFLNPHASAFVLRVIPLSIAPVIGSNSSNGAGVIVHVNKAMREQNDKCLLGTK